MMADLPPPCRPEPEKSDTMGPLINEETRRLAASLLIWAPAMPGEKVLKKKPADLNFSGHLDRFLVQYSRVNRRPLPGSPNFFNTGFDVIISGIDTTEALVVARQKQKEGKTVWSIPYDICRRL